MKKAQKNTRTNGSNRKKALIIGILVLVVIIFGLLILFQLKSQKVATGTPSPTPSKTPIRGNTTADQPAATSTPSSSQITATPTKPTLQKSSGNVAGSSVPSGAIIEFSCEGTANTNCGIELQSKTNSNNKIQLGTKLIADNGRGQYSAIWDWPAITGSWTVTAISTNNSGASSTSDPQTLEVK